MASNKLFVDTWGWVTFSSRRETHYHEVHALLIAFTDLTSMVVMHERNIVQILTQDAHFAQVGFGFERVPQLAL